MSVRSNPQKLFMRLGFTSPLRCLSDAFEKRSMISAWRVRRPAYAFACVALLFNPLAAAAQDSSVRGTVIDSQAAVVPGANVRLLRDNEQVAQAPTDARGEFRFDSLPEGRYQVEVTAAGFETRTTEPTFAGSAVVRVVLQIGPLAQVVVVTAAATELPESQIGAPVTVVDSAALQNLGKLDVLEPLRAVPGVQVIQVGSRGGSTSLFIRGGDSDFNKILVDGVPANDIGGSFDFAQLATSGVESVEVLRDSNSVMYGSDSLSGVVNITTKRGRTRIPEASYSIDGGNLGSFHQAGGIGGAVKRFDYFSEISHFTTDNDLDNNEYRNTTYAGRFGVIVGTNTDVSGTLRWTDTRLETPNAFNYFNLVNDSFQTNQRLYATISSVTQVNDRLRTTVRYGFADQEAHFANPSPTGEPSDPFGFGANYLGHVVTINGANGYSVTGRAILDYGFSPYPQESDSSASRNLISGQVDFEVGPAFAISGAGRYEHERGFSTFGNPEEITRNNGGGFVEGRLNAGSRVYVSGGIGVEHNAIFDDKVTPRVSVAAYARTASADGQLGETKLILNAGKGIKAPSLFDEQSSLFALIPGGAPVSPIGPERSRTFDVGVEQRFWRGRSRVRVSYFNNSFHDLIEFVNQSVLPDVGVPPDVASEVPFGATVNSASFDAQGIETLADVAVGRVAVNGSYTFLDAEVIESFSGSVLAPAFNPAFPDIPIGQFSPLVGARPFRRPTHSGSLVVSYVQGRAQIALSGSFVGKRDDSTFLDDEFFGYSMLLPNHNLDDSYQKIDLSGSYRFHRNVRWYLTLENLLNQDYEQAGGFPSLPANIRTGVTVGFGSPAVQGP